MQTDHLDCAPSRFYDLIDLVILTCDIIHDVIGHFEHKQTRWHDLARAVDMVERLVRPAKVGHAGTLDPLATGVLVVCVGSATRLIEYVQRMPKSYVGTFLLGRQSTTEDIEGEVVELADPPVPVLEDILCAAKKLEGNILQRPPAFSALKINGRRAYKMARKGEEVKLQARPVSIHRIAVRSYEYPRLVLEVDCGSGTYIRSLGRDLAESLGTAAVMSGLVRTAIGKFDLEEAQDPGKLDEGKYFRSSFAHDPCFG